MSRLLKIGNPKKHVILELLNNINNPSGITPGIIDFSLDKDNLYISEDNIRSELWKFSDIYNQNINNNINGLTLKKRIDYLDNEKSVGVLTQGKIVEETYSLNLWNRYKQIYKINHTIDRNFIYDEDIKISFDIFSRLPFDSFFIEYPEDIQKSLYFAKDNKTNKIVGTFVTFIHDIDTTFDDGYNFKSEYNKLCFMDIILEDAVKSYPVLCTYGIREDETDGRYIKDIISKYLINDYLIKVIKLMNINKNRYIEVRSKIMSYLIQSILYICSNDVNTTLNNQANELKYNMSKIKNKNITISEIGYNIPEEDILIKEDVDKRNRKNFKNHESTGRINKPHWRKAHWHYYWCGKGKTELRLKFILPILINGDKINEKVTTIVRNKTLDI